MNVDDVNAFTEASVGAFETSSGESPIRHGKFERRAGPVTNSRVLTRGLEFPG